MTNTERIYQDEAGQWWYRYGTRGLRTKTGIRKCDRCGRAFVGCPLKRAGRKPVKHCSRTCGILASYAKHEHPMGWRGDKSRRWKGGRRVNKSGYVVVHKPEHHSIKYGDRRYVLEHRLVMEEVLGRNLLETERVHHKNGNKTDNRPENLELWQFGHPPGQRREEQKHCQTCTCWMGGV